MPAREMQSNLKQVATIPIPGIPVNQLAGMAIDPATGLGYLADKDNNGVVVFDTKTDAFVSRIGGFLGLTGSGKTSGPNGLTVIEGRSELWASDGDSTIKVVDVKSGRIKSTIATGGKRRANGMSHAADAQVVLVANSNEETPFLSLISTEPGNAILARIPIPECAENLERSAYDAANGMFYTAIPVLKRDGSNGIMAQVDAKAGRLVKLHELEGLHPHSLQVVSDTTIFLGCSSAHGAEKQPGGDLAVFDISSQKVVRRDRDSGGNGSSTLDRERGLYYHATTAGKLIVLDTQTGDVVDTVSTSKGARSVGIGPFSGKVYLATTAKHGPCAGCIQVYAWE